MGRGRIFIYLALIVILGLVAVVIIWQRYFLPASEPTAETELPTPVVDVVNVVLVTQKIPRGTVLREDILGLVPIQRDLFIPGMYTDINEAVGLIVKFDLDAGIPLTNGMVAESAEHLSGTGSIAALAIPRGMVAVSIPIDQLSSVSYAPKPGDHVNIIATMLFVDLDTDYQTLLPNRTVRVISPIPGAVGEGGEEAPPGENIVAITQEGGDLLGRAEIDPLLAQTFYVIPTERQRPRMVSQNLIQDAIVLGVGEFPIEGEEVQEEVQQTPQPTPEAESEPPPPPPKPQLITLVVTPQDAIALNYSTYSGIKLTLALRSADDDTRVQTEAVTLRFLLDQYNIPVPAKLTNGLDPSVIDPSVNKNGIEPSTLEYLESISVEQGGE